MTETDDRPATEIKITPEMVAAGRAQLFQYDPDFDNEDEIVEAIFRAMLSRLSG